MDYITGVRKRIMNYTGDYSQLAGVSESENTVFFLLSLFPARHRDASSNRRIL